MNERQLKDIFKQGGNVSTWKPVLDFVFGKVEYFTKPGNPFTEDKKVISGKQSGRIKLDDGKSIALFEVEVDKHINIERNRQGLREIAVKHIDQNITHGALVFYYAANQEQYRLTFIAKWSEIDLETGELKKGETQKKRYTYLLGGSQSGATAAKRLLELAGKKPSINMQAIIHAFSVEALTKEFFKKYKEHYERFWRFIDDTPAYQKLLLDSSKDKTPDEQRKPIRDFSKKLLGRIVFLHFLQKKGWMGCPVLSNAKKNNEVWKDGNPSFLYDLFTEFKEQKKFYSKCLTKLFFTTLNQPERPNNIFELTNSRVPYLNGGLFDNDQSHTDHIDFPVEYFGDLLEFFGQYNFTIDENSPDEQEIGIDPEMLGHIFENLLEENREKGAFYTPKEIVHYMCQESLIEYLKNHLPDEADVAQFIRQQQVSEYLRDKANATKLSSLLDDVKVCDPAIGSGAFPIGVLQEIYKAKLHIYPYLKSINPFDPAETKKRIIEESIYGVDLEHGAVEIARLRFWLALVVDEDVPQPLPNLDYKIMQGNSLLEQFEGIDLSLVGSGKSNVAIVEPSRDLFGNILENQMKMTFTQTETVKEIQQLIKKYFSERKPEKKADLKVSINQKVHQHIDYNLELRESQLARMIEEAGDEEKLNAKAKNKLETLKKELTSFASKRAKLHAIQNTEEKPYFLWHVFFKDVFDQGGFDIVIGNPPYIQLQKMGKDADVLEDANFETFARTGDIYCLFYEKGNQILKKHGVLSFITSNKWMTAGYGKNFRKFLLNSTNPTLLIDFSKAVIFPAAVVFVNILNFKKESNQNQLWAAKAQANFQIGVTPLQQYVSSIGILLSNLQEDNWNVADKKDFDIISMMDRIGIPLKEWELQFFRGVTTGLNEVFHITEKIRDELIAEDAKCAPIIKPLLRGKDIKRYKYDYEGLYLIFTKQGINIDEYPSVKNYLSPYQKELSPKNHPSDPIGRKPGSYRWYEIQDNTAYYEEFSKDKIIWIEISDKANYCLDTRGHYLTNSAYFITGENLKYLLCILNSRLIDFYFFQNTAQIAGGRKRYTKQYVEILPIIQLSNKVILDKFEVLCDYLLFLNNEVSPSVNKYESNINLVPVFEDVMNMMVFELYFSNHLKQLEIDVLDLMDMERIFKPINGQDDAVKIIGDAYKWLQQSENPIRNRIILANIKSTDIIRRVNSTTH